MTTNHLPTVLMSADEARSCVTAINDHLTGARAKLLDLYEREGWRALGYDSWRSCVLAEFGSSRSALYRELDAAMVERSISAGNPAAEFSQNRETIATEQTSTPIPTDTLRPLARLAPEQQRPAWDAARRLAGGATPTARQTQSVVTYVREQVAEGVAPAAAIERAVEELQRRPTPREADTLARETGLAVASTDNVWHDGRTRAELAATAAETGNLFAVIRALEAVATHEWEPAQYARRVPSYLAPGISAHLDRARAWLDAFAVAWAARGEAE